MGMASGSAPREADVAENSGVMWRVAHFEQGSLPDLSVGDLVAIDVTHGHYVVAKAGVGRVATLPASSWKLEHCPATHLSVGSLRYDAPSVMPCFLTFSNPAERIKVHFDTPPDEALLDPDVQTLIKERSVTPSGAK